MAASAQGASGGQLEITSGSGVHYVAVPGEGEDIDSPAISLKASGPGASIHASFGDGTSATGGWIGLESLNGGGGLMEVSFGAGSVLSGSYFGALLTGISGDGGMPGAGGSDFSLGAGSTVTGAAAGIVSMSGTDLGSIRIGDDSTVTGGWSGIIQQGFGNADIRIGDRAVITAEGAGVPMDYALPTHQTPDLPGDPSKMGDAIYLSQMSLPGSGPLAVSIVTGTDSVVQATTGWNNGINATAMALDGGVMTITTGTGSRVEGGETGLTLLGSGGLGTGFGIAAKLVNGSISGEGALAELIITTGEDSETRGGLAGIGALISGPTAPSRLEITTGAGSLVEATGTPYEVSTGGSVSAPVDDGFEEDLPSLSDEEPGDWEDEGGYVDEGTPSASVTIPTAGIMASGFGSANSELVVTTGTDSETYGSNFGISVFSGMFNSAITVTAGAGSTIAATGTGTSYSYSLPGGDTPDSEDPAAVLEAQLPALSGSDNASAGIFLASTQYTSLYLDIVSAELLESFDPHFESPAGDLSVVTEAGSTVTGENGIAVMTANLHMKRFYSTCPEVTEPVDLPEGVDCWDEDRVLSDVPTDRWQDEMIGVSDISGRVLIDVTGTVTGTGAENPDKPAGYGIFNRNFVNPVETIVTVGAGGIVEGEVGAVLVESHDITALNAYMPDEYAFNQDAAVLRLGNAGTVRNLSEAPDALAIRTSRTIAEVSNRGLLLGTVDFDSVGTNFVANQAGGIWNMAGGTSSLGRAGLEEITSFVDNQAGALVIGAADDGAGEVTTFTNLAYWQNAGDLSLTDGATGDQAVIQGDYRAAGGRLLVDSFLTGDSAASSSDLLVIGGSALGGTDRVRVSNVNSGAATGEESVLVIQVEGESVAGFELDQRVVSGAYEYFLNRHDDDGSWYLESQLPGGETPVIRPETGAYAGLMEGTMFLHSWRDRHGASRPLDPEARSWLRFSAGQRSAVTEGGQLETELDHRLIHGGVDLARWSTNGQDEAVVGLMAGYGWQSGETMSRRSGVTAGSELEGWGLGLYGTWTENGFGERGLYLDAWAMYGAGDAKVSAPDLGTQRFDLTSTTASVELGYGFDVHKSATSTVWLEPQAQLVWTSYGSTAFTDASGTRVSVGGDSLIGRLGLRASWSDVVNQQGSTAFVQLDWLKALDRPQVTLDGFAADFGEDSAVEIGLGYDYAWSARSRANFQVSYSPRSDGAGALSANLGLNIRF